MNRILILLMFVLFTTTAHSQHIEREDLQFLIIEALTKNPEIAADIHKMRVWEEKVPQAGALDDPQFTYKLMEFPGSTFGEALFQNFEFMQMIMFPTKLLLKSEIAALDAEHAHHEHLEKEIDVISQLKSTYAMLWAARMNLNINLENQRLLQQILKSAETQYAVGKTSQQDVLKSSIELVKLRTEESTLRQEITSAESMMRAILNRPQQSPVGLVAYDSLETISVSLERLIAFAKKNRPMVIHDSLGVVQGDLMATLSKQEYLPDFKFSVERVTYPVGAPSRWTVMAGISIPFAPWSLSKASARVQEAQAERMMRESMFRATQNMVEAQIRDAYAKVKAFENQVKSLESIIIPQTYQSLQSLLVEYQTGKTSFIMLLDGYRMYQKERMEAVMARMKYEQWLAKLERQTGVADINVIAMESKEESQ
jgi:outer membrane protein TolC